MAEKFVDAALSAAPDRAFFFIEDQYVVWNYTRTPERVDDGVHSIDSFPPASAGSLPADLFDSPTRRVTAALQGKRKYAGASYFFGGSKYSRFNEAPARFVGARDTASAWNLPAGAATPDGCFNGGKNRKDFCYFFNGPQYWRYVWNSDAVSPGYPKAIATLVNMPSAMHGGIDAAVDGPGAAASENFDAGYLFKDDKYVRFDWKNDGEGEPRAQFLRDINEAWPGLAELLAAARAKSEALTHLNRAMQLTGAKIAGTLDAAQLAFVNSVMTTHFKASDNATAGAVNAGLSAIAALWRQSATKFRFRTLDEGRTDRSLGPTALPEAAYGAFGGQISFTPTILQRTPANRVLVVMHEAVHVIDSASGAPANHIPEWWVSPPLRAGFGLPATINWTGAPPPPPFYDAQPVSAALHNPSSFASYARHVATGNDIRV